MKRILWIGTLFLAAFGSAAHVPQGLQGGLQAPETSRPKAIRIKIRHADPWFVKGMLEGQTLLSPELSAFINGMGIPTGAVKMIDKIFDNGVFVVNAADNSLWWIPNRG